MKNEGFLQDAIGLIDEEIIADAAPMQTAPVQEPDHKKISKQLLTKAANKITGETDRRINKSSNKHRKTVRIKRLSAAVCAACLLLAAAAGVSYLVYRDSAPQSATAQTDENGRLLWTDTRKAAGKSSYSAELSLIWPWELETVYEQYPSMTLNDIVYRTRAKVISESLLGEELGNCIASGYDIYEDKTHQESFSVRAISGISPELLTAVKLDENYYVFMNDTYAPPATLGELMDDYCLSSTLPLTRYNAEKNNTAHTTEGYYALPPECSETIWLMLEAYRDTPFIEADPFTFVNTEYLSFSASSEALGITNKSFRITATGYITTNIAEWGYDFYIGEKAAAEIISYARENASAAEPTTAVTLVGIITEIGENYIKVDDSVMMKDPSDGITFTVMMEDIRLKRYILHGTLSVGQTVVVHYDGKIYEDNLYVIENVLGVDDAVITSDGDVLIPE